MTTEQLEIIKANAHLVIKQCENIEDLKNKLNVIISSNYYDNFSDEEDREADIKQFERYIHDAETILNGMLK